MASASNVFLSKAKQRRRDDIVSAALKVFERDGFEGARIDDVAEMAEVAKGTVYLYFENKQALFKGVIQAVVKPAVERLRRASEEPDRSASERLCAQIDIISNHLARGQMKTVLRLMIAEGPRHDEVRRFYYQEIVAPGMKAIRKCLVDGEASGEFRRGAGALEPQIFAGVPVMAAVWQILFNDLDRLDIDRLLKSHLANSLAGLRPEVP